MGQGNPSAWSLWCIWAYLGVGGDSPAKQLCFTNCGQSNLEISNVGMAMVRHSRDVMPNIYPLVTDVLVDGFKFSLLLPILYTCLVNEQFYVYRQSHI